MAPVNYLYRSVALALLLSLLLVGCSGPSATKAEKGRTAAQGLKNPYPVDPHFLKEGEEVYKLHCAICHGLRGEKPDYHSLLAMGRHHAEGDYYWVVNNGLNQTMGPGVMPPWKDKLSEREKWAVVAYIQQMLAQ